MSFAEQPRQAGRARFSLAPMLDILFLLLVFFVTTSTFQKAERQVDVELPKAESSETPEASQEPLVINVKADGGIVMAGQEYNLSGFREALGALLKEFPQERVVIRGDQKASHGRVISVMDAARAEGVRKIYFATVKSASELAGG